MLLGDIIEDANMAKNIDYQSLISIGFLNNPQDLQKEIEVYEKVYDIIITNDGNFIEVNKILNFILSGTKPSSNK